LHRDLREGALDLLEIVRRKFDGNRTDVLVQALQLPAARDGNNPRLLGKQPRERDLSWCGLLLFSDLGKQIN
jgi:hypothetical protein